MAAHLIVHQLTLRALRPSTVSLPRNLQRRPFQGHALLQAMFGRGDIHHLLSHLL